MPYFKWRGVTIDGAWRSGKTCAYNDAALDAYLFKRGIALVNYRLCKVWAYRYPITYQLRIRLFEQLSALLQAGIRLPDALTILAEHMHNPRVQDMVYTVVDKVRSGGMFHEALHAYHNEFFDSLTLELLKVGEQAGELVLVCNLLKRYLQVEHAFYSRLRSVLLMPAITAGFMVVVVMLLFGIMVPQLSMLFGSLRNELPPLTKAMIRISALMRSWYAGAFVCIIVLVVLIIKRLGSTTRGKALQDALLLKIPLVRSFILQRFAIQFAYSLTLLMQAGMPLAASLSIIAQTTTHAVFKQALHAITMQVSAGIPLSQALYEQQIFAYDMVAVIAIGEESNTLPALLKTLADRQHEALERSLHRITTLVQPCLMLALGLVVALIIMAVYTPIINVAYHVV